MTFTPTDLVRQNCGETIPVGGADTDTMFTDAEIQGFLSQNLNLISRSSAHAWRVKAARLATLVDVQEGNSYRKMSQAIIQAKAMANFWAEQPENPALSGQTVQVVNRRIMPW